MQTSAIERSYINVVKIKKVKTIYHGEYSQSVVIVIE